MKLTSTVPAVILTALAIAAGAAAWAQEHEHGGASGRLGTVHFATSCSQKAQPPFDRAVALLHSFEFSRAIESFNQTLEADQSCAIAYWGIAMSRWSNPFAVGIRPPAQLQKGLEAVDRGSAAGAKTPRERAYIDAAAKLYRDFDRIAQHERVLAYRDAMAAVAERFADDPEASIFYALSLSASEEPTDKTYASRLKAGAILEKLFAAQPDHPGLAHYIIHSYDVPPLAGKALDAASRYAKIAPDAPHALHMPAHTFTRVGYWQDSIDTNIASAAAARRDRATGEELHASDYQMYAYLQTAQDAAAKRLLDALPEMMSRFDPNAVGSAAPPSAGFFAYAAIPARWALERGAWAEAARLEPHPSPLPYADAITYFARALGAARSGDAAGARAAVDMLQQLRDREAKMNEPYWTEQIEIQRRAAAAWLAFAEGRREAALDEVRRAADAEDRTEKSAVTPGPLAPARELLGEMLLEVNQPAQALKEFEATLSKEPNRFRTLHGAARAAKLAGNQSAAAKYYGDLIRVCQRADQPGRPELQEARRGTHVP
jgi:tetratricopeptide (TPR) repeat protein